MGENMTAAKPQNGGGIKRGGKVSKYFTTGNKTGKESSDRHIDNRRNKDTTEKIIDWERVNKLCFIQCTAEEIAAVMSVSVDTLERHCKKDHNMLFADYIAIKKQGGKMSLRRKQHEIAMSGDRTMLIWLGKQHLGQSDKQEIGGAGGVPLKFQVELIGSKNDTKKPVED